MESRDDQSPGRGKDLRPQAIAALLALLAGATVWARFADERPGGPPLPGSAPEPRLCAGIEVDGELLGLASGETWEDLAASAVERLGLPACCAPLVFAKRERGAVLRFAADREQDNCEPAGVASLPAPARLLCGTGLDINRDSARDLELLPGVGPIKAGALVESRERDGPFLNRGDLERVRGIGPRTARGIAPWLDGID
ncbi:MAG TPA: helix-hairpin-helix domain-containing protein [Polyangia bacterium]|nr:helix-hairpin-helix domain-containing protein [Polyangia bacterium]